MKKIEIYLGGLNCANCARKIEDKVSKIDEISEASLNFIKKNLKFEIKDGVNKENIIEEVKHIIDTTEPGLDLKVVGVDDYEKEESSGCG